MLVMDIDISADPHLIKGAVFLTSSQYEYAEMAFMRYLEDNKEADILMWKVVAILRSRCNAPTDWVIDACHRAFPLYPEIYFLAAKELVHSGSIKKAIPLFQISARNRVRTLESIKSIYRYQSMIKNW